VEYAVVKWIHVVSSTLLFGTGIGSAFYLLVASWRGDPHAVHFVARHVVIADWLFTATSIVVQPVTGFWLVHLAHFPLRSAWLAWSIALYGVAALCWLPVVWLQMRMRDLARDADAAGAPLPAAYWRCFRGWFALGVAAFLALVVVFYLMVAKPLDRKEVPARVSRQADQPRLRIIDAFHALEAHERERLRAHRHEHRVVQRRQGIGADAARDVDEPREAQVAQQVFVVELLDAQVAYDGRSRLPLVTRQGPPAMAQAEDAKAHGMAV
jgi:uncharacterized membrane protein